MRDLFAFLEPYVAVSVDEATTLAEYLRPVSFEPGETIFAAGETCRDVVLFTEGLVRAFYVHEHKQVNLRLLRAPAAAAALSSLITAQPSAETIEAITAVSGYRSRLKDYEEQHPDGLADRMRRVLAEQHYLSMDRRLRMLQWKSASERYAYFLEHMEPEIVERVPGYHIASYLGVAPESLSRVRGQLKKSKPD